MAAASPPPPEIMNLKPDNIEPDDPQASVSGDISLLPAADPPASITPPSVTPSADLTHPAAETVNLSTDSTPAATPTPAAPAVVTPPPHPVAPSFTPSFRPLAPQFSPVTPNPAFPSHTFTPQNPSIQPPGVTQPPGSIPPPGAVSGAGTMPVSVAPVPPPGVYYHHAPAQPPAHMPYWQPPPNGYMTVPAPSTQPPGMIPPPGIPRYPALYPGVGRPIFPPRPPASVGVVPTISRPPVPATGAPIVPPLLRPVGPVVPPTEKPQTTVYVGKIASTVDNEYIKSLLGLCGPVKSWKRPSDGNGTPRGFGFCEFESAEGVLRALRLLSKLNVDGQELVLNVNQATREYLERYIAKKTEREKMKETEDDAVGRDTGVSDADKQEPQKTDSNKDADTEENKKEDDPQNFGIVTDEDRNADKEALEKVKHMIEERLKTNPLPPPPPVSANADGGAMSNSELATKSKNGETDANGLKNAEEKNDDDVSSENKISSENDRAEGDRARRRGRSREREREYDIKREKEREVERYERDRERERLRRERERDHKIRETERLYKDRLKEWEAREREKEHQRHYEKEREKERESKRRREVSLQEDESDDDDGRKRRHRSSVLEERRRRRLREKEDDLADRRREEEEIAEARKRAVEEEKQKVDSKSSVISTNGTMEPEIQRVSPQENIKDEDDSEPAADSSTPMIIENLGDAVSNIDESLTTVVSTSEAKRNGSIPSRKLGFGLIGSGKKTTVPSVFHEEDDDELNKDKKMRPLVPIDYSTEELQAVQRTTSDSSPNLVAAAEYAKRISGGSFKEEKSLSDKDRRRTSDRHRVRNEDDSRHSREEGREQAIDRVSEQREREKDDKPKMTENKKLLDAKQLIDMIPKTKEELFSYDINWAVYDKHDLHERMRPWISKKITEFLGEEEPSLVDYIVSSTNSHMQASEMLDLLQSILDEEAEMFVLKMWRMLIFEIKKVEKGLSSKLKA